MDAFARGLLVADRILNDRNLNQFVTNRYSTWKSSLGRGILKGTMDTTALEKWVLKNGEPSLSSGRQEMLEIVFNDNL